MFPGPWAPCPRTLTVAGTGRAGVRPDLADLRLGVTITAATVEAARSASAGALTSIIERLKALGVEARDLQTSIVSVSPQYDYSREGAPPRLAGYTFSNPAGATNVDRIEFRVADQSVAERAAREAAVRDARTRAETFAKAAGVAIAGVASIVESSAPIPYPMPRAERMAFAAKDVSTPIEPGENEVVATVSISYLIG